MDLFLFGNLDIPLFYLIFSVSYIFLPLLRLLFCTTLSIMNLFFMLITYSDYRFLRLNLAGISFFFSLACKFDTHYLLSLPQTQSASVQPDQIVLLHLFFSIMYFFKINSEAVCPMISLSIVYVCLKQLLTSYVFLDLTLVYSEILSSIYFLTTEIICYSVLLYAYQITITLGETFKINSHRLKKITE